MTEIVDFNLSQTNLETGQISLEASAGTGKTYSLTVLAVRHVAERSLRADELLMVTFTKAATAELRERTRLCALQTLHCLQSDGDADDWMVTMLSTSESKSRAIENLTNFLSRFDETTITTIHGFCQIVLRRLGLNSPAPQNFEVQNDINQIIDQTITDLLAPELAKNKKFIYGSWKYYANKVNAGEAKPFILDNLNQSLSQMKNAVKKLIGIPTALALPKSVGPFQTDSDIFDKGKAPSKNADPKLALAKKEHKKNVLKQAELIADQAKIIVDEVQRRCFEAQIITYDDMVRFVRETIAPEDPAESQVETSKNLATTIAKQYRMIMVDEFQDTDATQWAIFKTIFDSDPSNLTLITVGDPKQSIFRFRGADIQVYIDAVAASSQKRRLIVNHRSDKILLEGLEHLLSKTEYDVSKSVKFEHVEPAAANERGKVSAISEPAKFPNVPGAPLELRYLSNHENLQEKIKTGALTNNSQYKVSQIFFQDLTNHIVELLTDGKIPDKDKKNKGKTRQIQPSDIAVLVRGHREAEEVVNYLIDSKVPAVRLKTQSVFSSMAAQHWLMLLGALANLGKPLYVRAYSISWFGTTTDSELTLVDQDDETVASWQKECAESAEILQTRGISALYLHYRNRSKFLIRALAGPSGERNITDLDQIAEALASIPRLAAKAGASECYETLQDLVADTDDENEEYQRRIESDHDSVTVMTVHTSKGLQYPIVFLPTIGSKPFDKGNNPEHFSFKFPGESSSQRIIDVPSGFDEAKNWIFQPNEPLGSAVQSIREFGDTNKPGRKSEAVKDRFYESMRLIYVALTRAEHKVIAYWSATGENNENGTKSVAFAKILVSHDLTLKEIPLEKEPLDELMQNIAQKSGGTISAIHLEPKIPEKLEYHKKETSDQISLIATAKYSRKKKQSTFGYARWSYSDLAKTLKGVPVESNTDRRGMSDESNDPTEELATTSEPAESAESVIAKMPMFSTIFGPAFGDSVHEIFDSIDPSAEDLNDCVQNEVAERFARELEMTEQLKITNGIIKSLNSPLGSEFYGSTLRTLGSKNRLSELAFDFRLPQDKSFKLSEIGDLMIRYGKLNTELEQFAQRVASPELDSKVIAGFMTGSIDAVFRVADPAGKTRYIVADYKTNRLHDPKALKVNPLNSYHPDNLVKPMTKDAYILQALVYSVALHRYLKWRQPDYDPDTHFAGTAYLFLRGMIGIETSEPEKRPYGVYFWRPETELILALDRLFAGKSN